MALAQQLGLARAAVTGEADMPRAPLERPVAVPRQPFSEPQEESAFLAVRAAKRAIADLLRMQLAKLSEEGLAFVNSFGFRHPRPGRLVDPVADRTARGNRNHQRGHELPEQHDGGRGTGDNGLHRRRYRIFCRRVPHYRHRADHRHCRLRIYPGPAGADRGSAGGLMGRHDFSLTGS
jgi:hypothetical protein